MPTIGTPEIAWLHAVGTEMVALAARLTAQVSPVTIAVPAVAVPVQPSPVSTWPAARTPAWYVSKLSDEDAYRLAGYDAALAGYLLKRDGANFARKIAEVNGQGSYGFGYKFNSTRSGHASAEATLRNPAAAVWLATPSGKQWAAAVGAEPMGIIP